MSIGGILNGLGNGVNNLINGNGNGNGNGNANGVGNGNGNAYGNSGGAGGTSNVSATYVSYDTAYNYKASGLYTNESAKTGSSSFSYPGFQNTATDFYGSSDQLLNLWGTFLNSETDSVESNTDVFTYLAEEAAEGNEELQTYKDTFSEIRQASQSQLVSLIYDKSASENLTSKTESANLSDEKDYNRNPYGDGQTSQSSQTGSISLLDEQV